MVFSSIEFLLFFLPIFFLIYYVTPQNFKNFVLLVGSLFFYLYGEHKYFFVLFCSLLFNFMLSLLLHGRKKHSIIETIVLIIGILFNGGILMQAKITDVLPLGISFFTFQSIAYLVDVYRGKVRRENNLVDYATYMCSFPQLLMGPIIRYGEVKPKIKYRTIDMKQIEQGAVLFVIGLANKVFLADPLSAFWNEVWVTGYENISTPLAWLAAIGFSLKLYFDFYGYSLMAIGLGEMLGFHLPVNFALPYTAKSVGEFYRRWHITLGRWFKEYVYIPLGGNRQGLLLTLGNLWIVWLITGFWHGSSLNFMLWAIFLWVFIAGEKILARFVDKQEKLAKLKVLPRIYVGLVITVSWMLFAITDLDQLRMFLGRMFGVLPTVCVSKGDYLTALGQYGVFLGIGILGITPLGSRIYTRVREKKIFLVLMAMLFWACVYVIAHRGSNPFMYLSF